MIGFIVTQEAALAITNAIADAQTSRGLPVYWSLQGVEILRGQHAGKSFIPFHEAIMETNLRAGMTPMDFPETAQLLAMLGGLDARIELDPADIAADITTDSP